MIYETIKVHLEGTVCHVQFHRPAARNAIDDRLVAECHDALDGCADKATIVVFSGMPEVFCVGADFDAIAARNRVSGAPAGDPGPLYDLWLRLANGPLLSVSHVRGKVNAGGVGFVAASDIALADETAQFSLSELLFGLYPACVLPFLIRRIGFQRAHYLTLTTQTIGAEQACEWGLLDACEAGSEALLRRHLQRLRRLSKKAILRYKTYTTQLAPQLRALERAAVAANLEVFSDRSNLQGIARYVDSGLFPWEQAV